MDDCQHLFERLKGAVRPQMKIQSVSSRPRANGKSGEVLLSTNNSGALPQNSGAAFSEPNEVDGDWMGPSG